MPNCANKHSKNSRFFCFINHILNCNSISINGINDAGKLGHQSDQSLWILESSHLFFCNSHQKLCLAVCAISDVCSSRRCLRQAAVVPPDTDYFSKAEREEASRSIIEEFLCSEIFSEARCSLSNWTYCLADAVGRVSWAAVVSLRVSYSRDTHKLKWCLYESGFVPWWMWSGRLHTTGL